MTQPTTDARIHRFHDLVAIHIGNGETCYLTPELANRIGLSLIQAAYDTDNYKFTNSKFATTDFKGS